MTREGERHNRLFELYKPARLGLGRALSDASSALHYLQNRTYTRDDEGRVVIVGGVLGKSYVEAVERLGTRYSESGDCVSELAVESAPKELLAKLRPVVSELQRLYACLMFAEISHSANFEITDSSWTPEADLRAVQASFNTFKEKLRLLDSTWQDVDMRYELRRIGQPDRSTLLPRIRRR